MSYTLPPERKDRRQEVTVALVIFQPPEVDGSDCTWCFDDIKSAYQNRVHLRGNDYAKFVLFSRKNHSSKTVAIAPALVHVRSSCSRNGILRNKRRFRKADRREMRGPSLARALDCVIILLWRCFGVGGAKPMCRRSMRLSTLRWHNSTANLLRFEESARRQFAAARSDSSTWAIRVGT